MERTVAELTRERDPRLPAERMKPATETTLPCFYGLAEIPEWVNVSQVRNDVEPGTVFQPKAGMPAVWSGVHTMSQPPYIGQTVFVRINGFGRGEVIGYFVEFGWLGVYVVPEMRPAWHREQNPDREYCMVFGVEINKVEDKEVS